MSEFDPVEKPRGYNTGEVECIDALRSMLTPEQFEAHCRATAVAYIWRAPHKGTKEQDVKKAIWYLRWVAGEDPRER